MELGVPRRRIIKEEAQHERSGSEEEQSLKATEPAILLRLVETISTQPGIPLSTEEIPNRFQLSKRALNDFIAVTSAVGVTKRISATTFSFQRKGLDRQLEAKLAQEIELAAKRTPLVELFAFNDVPPINELTIRFIKLFLFLRRDSVDIRQAAKLMSTKNAKYKTVLRKLYMVTTSLEASGIVEKTRNLSEVRFVNNGWATSESKRMDVLSMLVDQPEREDEVYEGRRRLFDEMTL